jgi:cytochrome c biogenesis protein CcmG, thiol:disulfide interchange protein DsbE
MIAPTLARRRAGCRVRPAATALAATVLLASGALAGCGNAAERFRPVAVGEPVPAVAVRTLGGDSARVGPGEPLTLVNVWATWCVPCQREFGDLERLHRAYGGRGLRVLAVSIDKGSDEDVREFAREHGATFVIGRDPEDDVRTQFQSIGVPESYLVAADGRLLWRQFGAFPEGAAAARAAVERALGRRGE